jgi:hypothetical protein
MKYTSTMDMSERPHQLMDEFHPLRHTQAHSNDGPTLRMHTVHTKLVVERLDVLVWCVLKQ